MQVLEVSNLQKYLWSLLTAAYPGQLPPVKVHCETCGTVYVCLLTAVSPLPRQLAQKLPELLQQQLCLVLIQLLMLHLLWGLLGALQLGALQLEALQVETLQLEALQVELHHLG